MSRLTHVRDNFAALLLESPLALDLLEHAFRTEEGENGTRLYNISVNGEFVNVGLQRKVYTRIVSTLETVHVLYFGTETGHFYGIGHLLDESLHYTALSECHVSNGFAIWANLSPLGKLLSHQNLTFPFDPRARPWYQQGRELSRGNMSWTETFLDVGENPMLSLNLVRPVYEREDGERRLIGVSSTHLYLERLSHYLRTGALPLTDPDSHLRYLVHALEFADGYGMRVFVVAANPRRNVYREADLAQYVSLGLSGALFILSLAVSGVFAYFLSQPLRKISVQMKKIAQMKFSSMKRFGCGNTLRLYEYSKMNKNMANMSQGLDKFARFLPREVVADLVRSGKQLSLQMERRMMTTLFVDVDGFTSLRETLSPEELVGFLAEFFEIATSVIRQYDGTVDKLIGDCVMAFWNALSITDS